MQTCKNFLFSFLFLLLLLVVSQFLTCPFVVVVCCFGRHGRQEAKMERVKDEWHMHSHKSTEEAQ